jgi:hypothetical protein
MKSKKIGKRRICSLSNCSRDYDANGYCYPHNIRYLKYGDPFLGAKIKYHAKTLIDAFESRYKRLDKGSCWIWNGWKNKGGYGYFSFDGKRYAAHRHAWEIENESIKDNLMVCHHCDVPACVNPYHLFLGTNSDNVKDCYKKGRRKPILKEFMLKGEDCYLSKLKEFQVIEILKKIERGITNTEIAKEYKVIHQTISMIKLGKTWKHIKRWF